MIVKVTELVFRPEAVHRANSLRGRVKAAWCEDVGGSEVRSGWHALLNENNRTNGNVAADQQPRQSRNRLLQSSVVYTMLAQTVSNERMMCKTQCAVYADVRMQPLNIPPRASWCHYFTSAAVAAAEAYLHLPQRQHSSVLVQ